MRLQMEKPGYILNPKSKRVFVFPLPLIGVPDAGPNTPRSILRGGDPKHF